MPFVPRVSGCLALLLAGTALSTPAFANDDAAAVEEIVVTGQREAQRAAIEVKRESFVVADVVSADERESGARAQLNLGHTVGHAIETATAYGRYRHGEAVALGLLAALRLSGADDLRGEVERLNELHGLPVDLDPAVEVEAVVEAIGFDKKKSEAGVGFVMLEEPGSPRTGVVLSDDKVSAAVQELSR